MIRPEACWKLIPGGFKGNRVYEKAIKKFVSTSSTSLFIEIGSLMGQSTCFMSNSLMSRNITTVDFDVIDYWASSHVKRSDISFDWLPSDQREVALKFGKGEMSMAWHHFMLKTNSWEMINKVFHGSSTDANIVNQYKDASVDFIYLDTAHDARITTQELDLWWPKLKRHGLLCGDDYYSTSESEPNIALKNYAMVINSWFSEKGFNVKYEGQLQFCVTKN